MVLYLDPRAARTTESGGATPGADFAAFSLGRLATSAILAQKGALAANLFRSSVTHGSGILRDQCLEFIDFRGSVLDLLHRRFKRTKKSGQRSNFMHGIASSVK